MSTKIWFYPGHKVFSTMSLDKEQILYAETTAIKAYTGKIKEIHKEKTNFLKSRKPFIDGALQSSTSAVAYPKGCNCVHRRCVDWGGC